ncbi:hypothetical protein DFJ74DRAFT_762749 [Hyaloraphidium curvatum]|nr:hypothetical protein DFJ74DRAFT_762749 [Hyaloraphidium curvatum]
MRLLAFTALLAMLPAALALQWPWPIGTAEDEPQHRAKRAVSDRGEDEWGTSAFLPSWMSGEGGHGGGMWPDSRFGARDIAYMMDASRRSLLSPFSVRTTKTHYLAFLDVPGIPRSALNVTLLPSTRLLRVRGQLRCTEASDDFCTERTVSHEVSLPRDADLDTGVEVGVRDGVLRIRVPRREASGEGWKVLQVAEGGIEAATSVATSLARAATDAAKNAAGMATDAAAQATDAARGAGEAAREAAGEAYARAAEGTARATEAARQAAGQAGEYAKQGAEGAKKVVQQAGEGIKGAMGGNEGEAKTVKPTQA